MSHATCLVIVPEDTEDVQLAAEELMESYWEELEVESHLDECWCLGSLARDRMYKEAEALPFNDNATKWDWVQEHLAEAVDKDWPDPECDNCHGVGRYMSTSNPDGKWDWFTIGGRWAGALYDKEGEQFDENLGANSRKVSEITTRIFHSVITPDGEWHESATLGWFGITRNENTSWDEELESILKEYKDCIGVLVDFHC